MLVFVSLLASAFSGGCSVLFPAHGLSHAKDQEKVFLTLEVAKDTPVKPPAMRAMGMEAAAGIAADVVIRLATRALDTESKEYSASYSSTLTGEFYTTTPTASEAKVKVAGFKLERKVGEGEETAASFRFTVAPSDAGDAFRIKWTQVEIKKSKAKVLDASWERRWWSRVPFVYGLLLYDLPYLLGVRTYGDASVDLLIGVEMDAVWVDAKQNIRRDTIAKFAWTLLDVKLGVPRNLRDGEYATEWLPHVPVSRGPAGPWGRGNYVLKITVTETDDIGEYIAKAAELLRENREKIVEHVVRFTEEKAGDANK